jgi:FKBP-type peptidyl-prolyl cis-trans isomerase 2
MRGKLRLKDARDGKSALLAVIIVVVLLVSSFGILLFTTTQGEATVKDGSTVKVDYIGTLPDGRVFDTTLYKVANNNTEYPKSLFFSSRGNVESAYTPMSFTVGSSYLITGFTRGVMGMKVGETKTFQVDPSEGYPALDSSKMVTFNVNETLPVFKTMTPNEFKTVYKATAAFNMVVTDPKYGWDVRVVALSDSEVKIMNEPTNGSTYHVYSYPNHPEYGWSAQVTSYSVSEGANGALTIHHNLNASSIRVVGGIDNTGSSNIRYMIVGYDAASGNVTMYKNNDSYMEERGVTITFTVTVVSIT